MFYQGKQAPPAICKEPKCLEWPILGTYVHGFQKIKKGGKCFWRFPQQKKLENLLPNFAGSSPPISPKTSPTSLWKSLVLKDLPNGSGVRFLTAWVPTPHRPPMTTPSLNNLLQGSLFQGWFHTLASQKSQSQKNLGFQIAKCKSQVMLQEESQKLFCGREKKKKRNVSAFLVWQNRSVFGALSFDALSQIVFKAKSDIWSFFYVSGSLVLEELPDYPILPCQILLHVWHWIRFVHSAKDLYRAKKRAALARHSAKQSQVLENSCRSSHELKTRGAIARFPYRHP